MKLVKIYERMEELKCELEDKMDSVEEKIDVVSQYSDPPQEIQEKVYELEDIERDLAVAINSLMDAMEILEEYI